MTAYALAIPADEIPLRPDGGLDLRETLDEEEWRAIGRRLQFYARRIGWWLGDWYLFGERKYGERAAQAVGDATGHAAHTVQNAARVAERFEPSRRREDLSFGHHEVVAKLAPPEQDEWLERAAEGGWTVAETRGRLRASERLALNGETEETHLHVWKCESCGVRMVDA